MRALHLWDVVIVQITAQWSVDWFLYVVHVVSNITSSTKAKTFLFSIPLETSKNGLTSLLLQNDQYALPKLTVLWTFPLPYYCAFFIPQD